MMEEDTVNCFAICLVYYYNFCRHKLTNEDLLKIKKKYERKASQLLTDLQRKYTFPIPEKVTVNQVLRVIAQHNISLDYVDLCGLSSTARSLTYEQIYDITDNSYDADLSFESKKIFASFRKCPIEDNMSKVKKYVVSLLSEEERSSIVMPPTNVEGAISKSAARRAIILAAKEKEKEERRPFLDRLAEASIPKYTFRNDLGEEKVLASPLALIHNFMIKKERVRIIIRRRHAIRGSLDAYIQGFDRFWNLFLTDVDEEFILNKVSTITIKYNSIFCTN